MPSQTQNGRRRRVEEDVEEEDGEEDAYGEAEDEGEEGEERGDDDLDRKARDLVRLALFNEQRRTPLRRDEISKKVMGSKSRRFAEVYARAQQLLSTTFGMELVELQHRVEEKEPPKEAQKEKDKDKKDKNAPGLKKKAAPTGTKTYILRSKLDPRLIKIATSPDADILRSEQEDLPVDDERPKDEDERVSDPSGSIIAWENADNLGSIGLLYVILSLVLVHGRNLPDTELKTYLRRLRLTPNTTVPYTSRVPLAGMGLTLEQFLQACIRQGYLDLQRIGDAKGAQKKRGRAPAATQAANAADEGVVYEWRWGPRAQAEVGEEDIARFVADFMVERARREAAGGDEDEDDEDIEDTPEVRKMRERTLGGIERAAGGKLAQLS
ncbi:MAGE domain-containing protein [Phanerochaete sordida]|uniref:MAGE domain-containing protein n=1 Tax=Phanerochaete sordida TaxID=48140 RepID=A0A9P3GFU2_9APHY|nr:MAGE domain-containing protein [Phanerochaete sordida]